MRRIIKSIRNPSQVTAAPEVDITSNPQRPVSLSLQGVRKIQ
jgi:hypothetical protein